MKRTVVGVFALLLVFVLGGCMTTSPSAQQEPVIVSPVVEEVEIPVFQASSMLDKLDDTKFEQKVEEMLSKSIEVPAKAVKPESIPPAPLEEPVVIEPALVREEAVPEPKATVPEGLVFKAVGTGLTESEARSDAIAALSGILYSKVSSTIETRDKVNEIAGIEVASASSFSEHTIVSTDLPILGASFSLLPRTVYDPNRKAYLNQVEAVLKASVSLALYEGELASLAATIQSAEREYPSYADSLVQESAL
ncbi:MAG: hypothetical protein EOM32_13795, partial [Spirochaetia bacterium]|nr:hypothetical protein [Spirochaetia bacterium]